MAVDHLAFMEAICESPDDDLPRLVFADWLEEQGDAISVSWATDIRIQCEAARLKPWQWNHHERLRKLRNQIPYGPWSKRRIYLPKLQNARFGRFERGIAEWLVAEDWKPLTLDLPVARGATCIRRARIRRPNLFSSHHFVDCSHLTHLMELDLNGCSLGSDALQRLAANRHLRNVKRLSLRENRLSSIGLLALAESPHWQQLESLDLSRPGRSGALEEVFTSRLEFSQLRELTLTDTQNADALLQALGDTLHLPKLERLDLHFSRVTAEGVVSLVSNESVPGLRELDLEPSVVQEAEPFYDDELIEILWSLALPNLTGLSLAHQAFTDVAAIVIANSPKLANLEYLNLRHSHLTDSGVEAVLASERLGSLQYLDVRNNALSAAFCSQTQRRNQSGARPLVAV